MAKSLREGFTTGTAVSAAAKAAVEALLLTIMYEAPFTTRNFLSVPLPPFEDVSSVTKEKKAPTRYDVPLDSVTFHALADDPERVITEASVIKDGGDDPDATHGVRIHVFASSVPFSKNVLFALGLLRQSTLPEQMPVALPTRIGALFLLAGEGVGVVTLQGLPVPPGEPAINPVPRRQIAEAVEEEMKRFGWKEPLYLYLVIPDGAKRAEHTLNPRLGILGGISILGTQGTVRPYSHDAWQATITHGLSVAKAAKIDTVLFSTGRRSERALFGLYPHLPELAGVQAADFAAYSIKEAIAYGFSDIVWGCFMGKLLKLAQKLEYTHAKSARSDLQLLANLAFKYGAADEVAKEAAGMPTAVGAFALLKENAHEVFFPVLKELAELAYATLLGWASERAKSKGVFTPSLTLHVFSLENELLLTLP